MQNEIADTAIKDDLNCKYYNFVNVVGRIYGCFNPSASPTTNCLVYRVQTTVCIIIIAQLLNL